MKYLIVNSRQRKNQVVETGNANLVLVINLQNLSKLLTLPPLLDCPPSTTRKRGLGAALCHLSEIFWIKLVPITRGVVFEN